MNSSQSYVPSVGYFPKTFPRDPVNVNIYMEHLLLGQVLEPLVESTLDGDVLPAVAESWRTEDDGKSVEFTIRDGIVFSDGKPLTSADVKFTLERHAKSKVSQSRIFLKNLVAIDIVSARKIIIRLDRPYAALLKALSREQLGILPEGWYFRPEAHEPFVGTGPYRAKNSSQGWILCRNERYRDAADVKIPKWKVLVASQKEAWKNTETADFVPFATSDLVTGIASTKDAKSLIAHQEPLTHFFQSSIWCYPHGKSYRNTSKRQLGARVMAQLVKRIIERHRLTPATGIIPHGISGYLSELPKMDSEIAPNLGDRIFQLTALPRDYEMLNSSSDISAIERDFDVTLRLNAVNPTHLEQLLGNPPDFLAVSYAGGFPDPEGFLNILPPILQCELSELFENNFELYKLASETMDIEKRGEIYRELNKSLIEAKVVVPGWKHQAIRLRKPFVQTDEVSSRYPAHLKDYCLTDCPDAYEHSGR